MLVKGSCVVAAGLKMSSLVVLRRIRTLWVEKDLEAFAVHDGGASFIILLFGDPHLLESGQRGQDGASNPHGVLAFRWSNDL